MTERPFVLTAIEQAALKAIRQDRPDMLNTFSNWLSEVLDDLGYTSQRRVVTEAEVDELLFRLRHECVGRMLADMGSWGEDEDLREPVVDLLVRHFMAEAREEFVRQVSMAKRK